MMAKGMANPSMRATMTKTRRRHKVGGQGVGDSGRLRMVYDTSKVPIKSWGDEGGLDEIRPRDSSAIAEGSPLNWRCLLGLSSSRPCTTDRNIRLSRDCRIYVFCIPEQPTDRAHIRKKRSCAHAGLRGSHGLRGVAVDRVGLAQHNRHANAANGGFHP
jgi:hypothetical protein